MIDIKKKYKTRSGKDVVIYSTEGFDPEFPVIGGVVGDKDAFTWSIDGMYSWEVQDNYGKSQYDIIETFEPPQYTAENINTYNFEQLSGVAKLCMDRMLELSKK
jgi:hypothetical protein